MHKCRNTEIRKYRNIEIRKYRNTEIRKYRNTEINNYITADLYSSTTISDCLVVLSTVQRHIIEKSQHEQHWSCERWIWKELDWLNWRLEATRRSVARKRKVKWPSSALQIQCKILNPKTTVEKRDLQDTACLHIARTQKVIAWQSKKLHTSTITITYYILRERENLLHGKAKKRRLAQLEIRGNWTTCVSLRERKAKLTCQL